MNSLIWILLLLFTLLCYWLHQTHHYWKRQHVPYIKPQIFFGNLKNLFSLRVCFGELFQSLYSAVEAPVVGVYMLHTPALIIRQPELIERILIKDFAYFLNRYEAADPINDAMGSLHLALAKYHIWRPSRIKISEFFTSGRLKKVLYPKMLEIAQDLEQALSKKFSSSAKMCILEVKALATLFTTDLTAYLLYGFKAKGLVNNSSEIQQLALELLRPNLVKTFNFLSMFFMSHQTTSLRTKCFTKTYENYFRNLVEKRKSTEHNDGLLDFLKKAQKEQNTKISQHPDFLAAQAAIFLLAGFETSSSLLAFTLYELAKQPDIQTRLRLEIKQSLENQHFLSYEQLTESPYLQQCVAEALRLYPAAAFINRECTAEKEYSLEPFANFKVPTGMPLYISILGIHRNEKYWPNPLVFQPERFSVQNLPKIQPMSYLPFGAGPHSCVGKRLGYLQIKLGLVHILKDYKVEVCAQTPMKIEFEPTSFMLQSKSGIQLCFIKVEY